MIGVYRYRIYGFTLIEVMITLIVALVVAIGVITYMYATAVNARLADEKANATRLGLLLLEGWKTQLGDIIDYNPKTDFDDETLIPFQEFADLGSSENPPGLSDFFKYYRIKLDGTQYFVKMSYHDDADNQRELNVSVAWDRNSRDGTLDFNPMFFIAQSKFAHYVVE